MKITPIVYSLHWRNISSVIIESQKSVFKYLNIPLSQQENDGKDHGEWMTEILEKSDDEDIIIFCDIDAFPLNRSAYENSVAHARSGGVFGLAQFSNHLPGSEIYAGPMFMALSKSVWIQLGRPNLSASKTSDAAEILSILASDSGVSLQLSHPVCCIKSKWALANQGVFGIGTFYGKFDFFHLFESRQKSSVNLISRVADDIICARPLDFSTYLRLVPSENVCDRVFSLIRSFSMRIKKKFFR